MQRFLGIILFFIFVVGCKSDQPANVIKEKDMANLLLDLHLAEGYIYTGGVDSVQTRSADYIAGVYQRYRTDSATVRESLEYYAAHPQTLNKIYQDIDKRLKAMETSIREKEEKEFREITVRDSIRNAFVADSISTIRNDSARYAILKHLFYWKNPDSVALKPKKWDWKKETVPSKRYFNYTDSMFLLDSIQKMTTGVQKDSIIKKEPESNKTDTVIKNGKGSNPKTKVSRSSPQSIPARRVAPVKVESTN